MCNVGIHSFEIAPINVKKDELDMNIMIIQYSNKKTQTDHELSFPLTLLLFT